MLRIGLAADFFTRAAHTFSGAIASSSLARRAVDLYEHGVVDVTAEVVLDGTQIGRMAVCSELDAIC
jgi:hypothetical protein